jgi:cardiolipin synthase
LSLGNRVDLLIDGPATYAAMFEAIDQARPDRPESYIVEADGPGKPAERLLPRRREGVRVNLLSDGFGRSPPSRLYFDAL